MNRYTFRIQISGQLGRVLAAFNVRNLGRGKGNDFVVLVAPVIGIKIMEVSSGRTNNDYSFF